MITDQFVSSQYVKFRNEIPEELKNRKFHCDIADPKFHKELKELNHKTLNKWEYWLRVSFWDKLQPKKTFIKVKHQDIIVASDPILFMRTDEADGNARYYQTQDIPQTLSPKIQQLTSFLFLK